jgi:hypothetical protein
MNELTYWMTAIGHTLIEASEPLRDLGKAVTELSGVLADLGTPDRTSYIDATVLDSGKHS